MSDSSGDAEGKLDYHDAAVNFRDLNAMQTVLLVEKDPQIRQLCHLELEENGYNLLEACDEAEALLVAELYRRTIDLLVVDVAIQPIDGTEFVSQMLKLRPFLKVLIISDFSESEFRRIAEIAGTFSYFSKRLFAGSLLDHVRALLKT